VHEQLERAASYYRDGQTTAFEMVMQSVGSDIAYTVEIERFRAKVGRTATSQRSCAASHLRLPARSDGGGGWCIGMPIHALTGKRQSR